jgi:PAS domain S-box-containing protein
VISPLRILYLEDDPRDAELVQATLEAADVLNDVTRVETQPEFTELLKRGGFDLIFADYTLPSFDGISALRIAKEIRPLVPFIFVTGTLGEEVAIEALKLGATDYVFKTRLSRILPSVQRALRESKERSELTRAEEALRRNEAYLAEAQRLSHTGSFGWKVSSGNIYWSEETFRIFDLEPATHTTLERAFERLHPEDRQFVRQIIDSAAQERKDFDFEHRLLLPDGSVKYVRVVGHPREESGNLEFVGALTDITESKRAEQALRRSEQNLRDVIETIPTMAWTALPDGANDFANQRWQEYTGISLRDTSGAGWKAAFHPADVGVHVEKWRASLATGKPFENEARLRRAADREHRWFLHRGVPLRDERGDIVKWYGTATDIEDRKRAEEALRRSEAYLGEAQRLSHSGSWAWNFITNRVYWSEEAFRIYGFNPGTAPTRELFQQRVHPDDLMTVEGVTADLLAGRDVEYNFRLVLPDNSIKHVHSVAHAVTDENGQVVEFIGTVMDVTEQRNAHDALKKAFEEIKTLRDQLYKENIALRDEVDKASMFEEIVGESPALHSVLARLNKVAPTDSTVLITGETGTGKELIARAIHKRSQRSSRAFVTVNCASIPTSLIASELFGHERGAFTGALQRRLGRFELAEGGTVFLDEVGELPMETQIALLRVLQEREFERVGGNQPIRADVRVIAATNRDLQAAISSGAFRSDLFYRLNVIPMEIPSLRERKEDIPMLIEYFINRYSRKAGKKIRTIEKETMDLLQSYSWPGNIRELQNVIERSVVVCETDIFSVDQGWFSHAASSLREEGREKSIGRRSIAQEKEIIEAALAETQGRVSGPAGAATQLGMPASTLESKIRALKINKHRFKNA